MDSSTPVNEPMVRPMASRGWAALFSLHVGLLVVRCPRLWIAPRLWAEEGCVYFRFALDHDFLGATFAPHLGYFAFVPNIATALAALVPLAYAPFVTLFVAALVQTLPALLILDDESIFDDARTKALGIVALVLPASGTEVWLNTINSQFWLALACVLTVATRPRTLVGRTAGQISILVGSLTGPVSVTLAPLFFVRAWQERNLRLAALGGTLFAGGLLQASMIHGTRSVGDGLATRAAAMFVKLVALPLLGDAAVPFARFLVGLQESPTLDAAIALASVTMMLGMTFALGRRLGRGGRYLLAGVGILAFVGAAGAQGDAIDFMNPRLGSRYAFAPAALSLAAGVVVLRRASVHRWMARLGLLWLLSVGLHFAVRHRPIGARSGRHWRDDVARFERDPGYSPRTSGRQCRLAPRAAELRRQVHVSTERGPEGAVTFGVTVAPSDRGVEGEYFVLYRAAPGSERLIFHDGRRWIESDVFLIGEADLGRPGQCWGAYDSSSRFTPFSSGRLEPEHEIVLSRADVAAIPAHAEVFVGYGRDAADALAKGTLLPVGSPEWAQGL